MSLLWAFENFPVEGDVRPDPKNAEFVDAVVAYVHRPFAPVFWSCFAYRLRFWITVAQPLSVANSDRVLRRLFDSYARLQSMRDEMHRVFMAGISCC